MRWDPRDKVGSIVWPVTPPPPPPACSGASTVLTIISLRTKAQTNTSGASDSQGAGYLSG